MFSMPSTDGRASTKIRTSLLLVGPQRSRVSPFDLTELRATITNTPDLIFLGDTVIGLESLWPTIVEAYPELKRVRGEESLRSLRQFLEGGEPPHWKQPPARNILFDVVTVLSQAVEFWRLATTKVQNDLFSSVSGEFSSQLQDIQGFCIGFLTAAAVASSKTKADFQKHIAVALRLALCVGALVELDDAKSDNLHGHAASISVGWNSESEYNEFKKILDDCQSVSPTAMRLPHWVEMSSLTWIGIRHLRDGQKPRHCDNIRVRRKLLCTAIIQVGTVGSTYQSSRTIPLSARSRECRSVVERALWAGCPFSTSKCG